MRTALIVLAVLLCGCVGTEETSTTVTTETPAAGATTSLNTSTTVTSETLPPEMTLTTVKQPTGEAECMLLSDSAEADRCLYDLAYRMKDRGACNKIGGDNLKFRCLARLEDKPDYCERIDVLDEKDICYRTMAFRWNNRAYCDEIHDRQVMEKCLYDYVRDKEADPYVCFLLTNSTLHDRCMMQHIELERINPNLCYLIVDPAVEAECNDTYL